MAGAAPIPFYNQQFDTPNSAVNALIEYLNANWLSGIDAGPTGPTGAAGPTGPTGAP